MKVLIACEESQEVCKAFRALGHEAYSCDIQEPSGGHPEWHILGDALNAIEAGEVTTMDGETHDIGKWDLLIAHPPCTYLTVAGAANIPNHPERIQQGEEAAAFFMAFYNSNISKIAIENPVPMRRFGLPPYTQIIRPYMFGHNNGKPVCLWLKNLPPLFATEIVPCNPEMVVWTYKGVRKSMSKWYNVGDRKDRAKLRSKTFPGIAKAMAEQYGGDIRDEFTDGISSWR